MTANEWKKLSGTEKGMVIERKGTIIRMTVDLADPYYKVSLSNGRPMQATTGGLFELGNGFVANANIYPNLAPDQLVKPKNKSHAKTMLDWWNGVKGGKDVGDFPVDSPPEQTIPTIPTIGKPADMDGYKPNPTVKTPVPATGTGNMEERFNRLEKLVIDMLEKGVK